MSTLIKSFEQMLQTLPEDPSRPGLKDTPARAADALQFLTSGYHTSLTTLVNDALFPASNNQMIVVKHIELYSLCEHHLLPFIGQCHIGYIPTDKILGLSKFARIVNMFARRLQVQEHLTTQIAEAIQSVTQAEGVAVVIEAKHLCMMMRGVEKQNSTMSTSVMLGQFRESLTTRQEFLNMITMPVAY